MPQRKYIQKEKVFYNNRLSKFEINRRKKKNKCPSPRLKGQDKGKRKSLLPDLGLDFSYEHFRTLINNIDMGDLGCDNFVEEARTPGQAMVEDFVINLVTSSFIPLVPKKQGGVLSSIDISDQVKDSIDQLDTIVGKGGEGAQLILNKIDDIVASLKDEPITIKHKVVPGMPDLGIGPFIERHKDLIIVVVVCIILYVAYKRGGKFLVLVNIMLGVAGLYFATSPAFLRWVVAIREWVKLSLGINNTIRPQGGILDSTVPPMFQIGESVSPTSLLPKLLTTGLFCAMFKDLKSTSILGLVEEFSKRNMHAKRMHEGLEFTVDFALSTIQDVANFISDLTGLKKIKLKDDPFWEVTVYNQQVQEKVKEYMLDPLQDSSFCGDLSQLKAEGESLRFRIARLPHSSLHVSDISLSLKKLSDLVHDLDSKFINVTGSRPEPLMVLLVGPAGVGKTSCMNLLWPEITARTLPKSKLQHYASHMGEYVKTYNQASSYYEGYNGQHSFVVDEFGVLRDVAGAPTVFSEMILWVNSNPLSLTMPDLESKGRTYFRSKFIWATSNRQHFRDIDSIVEKEAVYRRLSFTWLCAVKPQYATDDTMHETNPWLRRLDVQKLVASGLRDSSHLTFYKALDLRTGEFDTNCIELHELKDLILQTQATNEVVDQDRISQVQTIVEDIVKERLERQMYTTCGKCPSCDSSVVYESSLACIEKMSDLGLINFRNGTYFDGFYHYSKSMFVEMMKDYTSMPLIDKRAAYNGCILGANTAECVANTLQFHNSRNDVLFKHSNDLLGGWSPSVKNFLKLAGYLSVGVAGGVFFGYVIKFCLSSIFGCFGEDVVEQGDYPMRTKSQKQRARRKANRIMIQGGDDPNATNVMQKVVNRNIWRFKIVESDTVSYQGCVLCVQNNLVLMPVHYVSKWADIVNGCPEDGIEPKPNTEITFTNCFYRNPVNGEKKSHSFTITLGDLLEHYDEDGGKTATLVNVTDNEEDDVGILYIPGITGRSIVHLFRSKDQKIPTNHKGMLGTVNRDYAAVYHTSPYKFRKDVIYGDGTWGCAEAIVYDIGTRVGDCGSPFVIFDKSTEAKIVSIHVAGIGNVQGVGAVVHREGIALAVKVACEMFQILQDLASATVHPDVAPLVKENYVVTQGGPVFEATAKPIPQASKTKLVRSPIYDLVKGYTSKKAPALLRKVGSIDPMANAMWGYGLAFTRPRMDIYRAAIDDFSSELFLNGPEITDQLRRVLTFEEAIEGLPGEQYIDSINRKTSPGFPFKHLLTNGSKKSAFGEGEFEYTSNDASLVRKHVSYMRDVILSGRRPYVLNNHFLKDELRPLDRVSVGKTRLISSSDFIFSILLRQHTLMFSAYVMRGHIDNGVCIGMNPMSEDWNQLARRHGNNKPNYRVIAGDFSGYDKSLAPADIWALKIIMTRFYQDEGEDTYTVRNGLIDEIAQSRHLVGDKVYAWMGANTSGNAMTTLINSISGCILDRYAIALRTSPRPISYGATMDLLVNMRPFVKISRYGDDGLMSVQTNGPFDYISQVFLTDAFASIGMVYTDESKDSDNNMLDRSLVECTFLKRGFVQSHYMYRKRWMANLSLDTILESIQWTKDHDVGYEFWKNNVATQLMELSAHPRQIYDQWAKIIVKACADSGQILDVTSDRYREKQDLFISSEFVY